MQNLKSGQETGSNRFFNNNKCCFVVVKKEERDQMGKKGDPDLKWDPEKSQSCEKNIRPLGF
jgi:hypothetical protein